MAKENISISKILLMCLGWCAVWIILQIILLSSLRFDLYLVFADALVTQLILAAGSFLMSTTFKYYQPGIKKVFFYIVIWNAAAAAIITYLQRYLLQQIVPGQEEYLLFVNQSLLVRGIFNWLIFAFITIVSWLWYYLREQGENEARAAATEQLARDAELATLRQQLQPHFLFNSLNSISALAGSRPEEARKMVQQLSDFLRGTLKKDDKQLVTLEEELHHLQLYLEIEKVRFGYRLQTRMESDEASRSMKLPSLLLQPVVENAIKFGLYDTTGDTAISLESKAEGNILVLIVRNPFDPATSASRQGTGFGLSSIQRRLYLLFARHDLLTTAQEENTFITTIKIPQLS